MHHEHPQAHDRVLWFGHNGKDAVLIILQVLMLTMAMYIGTFLIGFAPQLYGRTKFPGSGGNGTDPSSPSSSSSSFSSSSSPFSSSSYGEDPEIVKDLSVTDLGIIYACAALPVIGFFLVLPNVLVRYIMVTNVEQMKDPDCILRVCAKMKRTQALILLEVYYDLRCNKIIDEAAAIEEHNRHKNIHKLHDRATRTVQQAVHDNEQMQQHVRMQSMAFLKKNTSKGHTYQQMFDRYDDDLSGALTKTELWDMFEEMGLEQEERVKALNILDQDGDNNISRHEFIVFMCSRGKNRAPPKQMALAIFEKLKVADPEDPDGEMVIELATMCKVMQSLCNSFSVSDMRGILHDADADGSGALTAHEFVHWVKETYKGMDHLKH